MIYEEKYLTCWLASGLEACFLEKPYLTSGCDQLVRDAELGEIKTK